MHAVRLTVREDCRFLHNICTSEYSLRYLQTDLCPVTARRLIPGCRAKAVSYYFCIYCTHKCKSWFSKLQTYAWLTCTLNGLS